MQRRIITKKLTLVLLSMLLMAILIGVMMIHAVRNTQQSVTSVALQAFHPTGSWKAHVCDGFGKCIRYRRTGHESSKNGPGGDDIEHLFGYGKIYRRGN